MGILAILNVNQLPVQSYSLQPGDKFTVTTDATGVAMIYRVEVGQQPITVASLQPGDTVTVGPYAEVRNIRVVVGNGSAQISDIERALPVDISTIVDSVNGKEGNVVLTAADVGALPDDYTAPVGSVNGKDGDVTLVAEDVGALKVGGQTGPLTFGTTDDNGITLLLNGNPFMIINSIGNTSFNTGTAASVPFLFGGGIWTQAGSVVTQINPTSGTDAAFGTESNHPVNLVTNGNTVLTLGTDGTLLAGSGYTPSEAKHLATKDYVDTGGPVSRTSGTRQLQLDDEELIWPNEISNGKIRLWNTTPGSENTYYGFGVQNGTLVYQVDSNTSKHSFQGVDESDTAIPLIDLSAQNGLVSSVDFHMGEKKVINLGDPDSARDGVNLQTLDARLSAAQRTAIDALDPAAATATDIVNALQAT